MLRALGSNLSFYDPLSLADICLQIVLVNQWSISLFFAPTQMIVHLKFAFFLSEFCREHQNLLLSAEIC